MFTTIASPVSAGLDIWASVRHKGCRVYGQMIAKHIQPSPPLRLVMAAPCSGDAAAGHGRLVGVKSKDTSWRKT